ncbi:MAG: hypothetical protein LBH20_05960 [Treponema sp.]|jgi:hypothetical protein|nr:hypothetical protein [Treponema sp.]
MQKSLKWVRMAGAMLVTLALVVGMGLAFTSCELIEDMGDLVVKNQTTLGNDIIVYVSAKKGGTSEHIGKTVSIGKNDQKSFPLVPGDYEVTVTDDSDYTWPAGAPLSVTIKKQGTATVIYDGFSLVLSGGNQPPVTPDTGTLRINNKSVYTDDSITVTAPSAIASSTAIAKGDNKTYTLNVGTYSVTVKDSSDNEFTLSSVAITKNGTTTITYNGDALVAGDPSPVTYTFTNNSSLEVVVTSTNAFNGSVTIPVSGSKSVESNFTGTATISWSAGGTTNNPAVSMATSNRTYTFTDNGGTLRVVNESTTPGDVIVEVTARVGTNTPTLQETVSIAKGSSKDFTLVAGTYNVTVKDNSGYVWPSGAPLSVVITNGGTKIVTFNSIDLTQ